MEIFIVGNKGQFSEKIANLISKQFKIDLFQIDKNMKVLESLYEIEENLKQNQYRFLIYLGGETRNNDLMERFNQDFLIQISKCCLKFNISLIYLSSLAVYGVPSNREVTAISRRNPFDLYGKTKNNADTFIKNNIGKNYIFSLIPASIVSDSENNFYVKLKKIMMTKVIKSVFYVLCPGGQFSFCTCEDIVDEIIRAINFSSEIKKQDIFSDTKYQERIVSRGVRIREIFYDANKYYPIFTMPIVSIKLLRSIFFFLPSRLLLRIIFLFSLVHYRNTN